MELLLIRCGSGAPMAATPEMVGCAWLLLCKWGGMFVWLLLMWLQHFGLKH